MLGFYSWFIFYTSSKLPSLVAQGDQRVDHCGAACGQEAGNTDNKGNGGRDCGVGERIIGFDAVK
jgi:hypothetical protein